MRIRQPNGEQHITKKSRERMEKQSQHEVLPARVEELGVELTEKEQLLSLSQAEAVELLLEENMNLQLAMAEMIETMMTGGETE